MKHCSLLTCALVLSLGSTLTLADPWKDESGHHRGKPQGPDIEHRHSRPDHDNYFRRHGYTQLDIPPGHYPPPGECRVWFPGRPPGHQPPPGRCHRAEVPPGAWLIRHPADRPDYVHVQVFDAHDPDPIRVVGEFEIGSGVFVRMVLD